MFHLLIHAAMMVANNAEHKSVWSDTVAALNVITGFNICHRELFFFVTFILCSQGKKIFIKKFWHLLFLRLPYLRVYSISDKAWITLSVVHLAGYMHSLSLFSHRCGTTSTTSTRVIYLETILLWTFVLFR